MVTVPEIETETNEGHSPVTESERTHSPVIEPDSTPPAVTVLYDGACPMCRREIGIYRKLEPLQADAPVCFLDISDASVPVPPGTTREQLLARFHVQRRDGQLISGAQAFLALWAALPGWRWLALAMVPALASAMAACTWHLFDNSSALQGLVVLQAGLTALGNGALALAAWNLLRLQRNGQLGRWDPVAAPPVAPTVVTETPGGKA